MLKPNLICLVGLVVMILLAGASDDTGTSVTPTSAPTASSAESPLPRDEAEFITRLASFKERYHAAVNEFQKSAVRRERSAALARSLRDRSVDGWIGTVSAMQTTGDGNGILEVKAPGYGWITITTWNNSLSDIGSGTLIPAGSPLYEQVSHLSVGEKITFAGTFGSSELDYLKESSLTEAGAMDEPEFIFTFSSVRSDTGAGDRNPSKQPEQQSTHEQASTAEPSPETHTEVTAPRTLSADEIQRLTKQRQYESDLIAAVDGILNTTSASERVEIYCRFTLDQMESLAGTSDSDKGVQDFTHRASIDRCKAAVLTGSQSMPDAEELREKAERAKQGIAEIDSKLKSGQ